MDSGSRLTPSKEFHVYTRNLPHWEDPGNVFFITFNTSDKFVLSDSAKDIVFASIKYHAKKKYELYACVIMDTHVHLILQPLEDIKGSYYSLAQLIHSIKSYSANRIQRLLNINGVIWQSENYDRIIRNEKEYLNELSYVINNPLKAGLVNRQEDYRWLFVIEVV